MTTKREILFTAPETVIVQKASEPTGVGVQLFGLAEYLLDNALTRVAAFHRDNVSTTMHVCAAIHEWRGSAQTGKTLTISEGQWETLCRLATPELPTLPNFVHAAAKALQALYSARQLPDEQ